MPSCAGRIALVVDDSPGMRRQLGELLSRLGVHALEAADGAQAWRQLQGMPVDIILTDINMPRMDGLKLISLVRAAGPHQRTPVVVITTEAAEADRRRAERLGATAYLIKPVQTPQLLEVVARLLAAG